MKLLFCGDIHFTEEVLSPAQAADALREVLPYAEQADYVIANCETVLADRKVCQPILKVGPNLIDAPENIAFFEALQTDVAILANNHLGDYGDKGLTDTMSLFRKHHIATVGAGQTIEEAYQACYLEQDGQKIALLAVCENEFGIASETSPGTAGFQLGRLYRRIQEEREKAHFVVLIFHGGCEWNPVPTPGTIERYRFLCDAGADAVIAMHPHCPQGYELYHQKPIVYSLGNFFFKPRAGAERPATDAWFYGYMAQVSIRETGLTLEVIPYRFDPQGTGITVFRAEQKEKMLQYLAQLSEIIQDKETVSNYFTGWCYRYAWTPGEVKDIKDCLQTTHPYTGDYDVCRCEAHNEKLAEIYRIMMTRNIAKAAFWAEKSKQLQQMPVT